ncbi:MAG: efflux RND transporter periplasmic adaptor subunit [Candidatus Melainabacteria bacterium]|nr:efflux RND transporter periplasmic adaptor subunit [Candidatus Melainabacteria bacterium]
MNSGTTKKFLLVAAVWVLIFAMGVAQCFGVPDKSGPGFHGDEPTGLSGEAIPLSSLGKATIGLQTQTVSKSPLPYQICTTGKIEAIPTHEFVQHALLSGRIKEVKVALGDTVKTGQVLVILDSPEINQLAAETLQKKEELEAEIKRQGADFGAEIKQAEAQVELTTATYSRDKKLFDEGIASQRQWQTSLADLRLAESRLSAAIKRRDIMLKALEIKLKVVCESLSHRLEQLGVSEDALNRMLAEKHTILTSPVVSIRKGIVTEMQASAGQSIDPNDVLVRISDLTRVWATADVYEDDMARMRLGQKVRVKVSAYPHDIFTGRLTFIGREVNKQTRTLPVRVEIVNSDLRLKPDMFAELHIETTEPAMSMIVPKEAVIQRTGHNLVFVQSKGGYQACMVKIGRSLGDNVEILEGLSPGQAVVVRGAFQLDAELLKGYGSKELFVQPIERLSQSHEREHQTSVEPSPAPISMQAIMVLVAAAFLFGFVVSGLMVRSPRGIDQHQISHSAPADGKPVSKN